MPYESQHMLSPGTLLNEKGELKEAGWATSLVRRYDRGTIRAGALRIKEWDYYCIFGENFALALTIADNSYMSLDSVSLMDFTVPFYHNWSAMDVMTLGRRNLPSTSEKGDVAVEKDAYSLRFENDGTRRVLTVRVDKFQKGKPLTARVVLTDPPRDSMVIATPFPKKSTAFYYNQKINCLRASGDVTFDGRTYTFDPDQSTAVLDWGRGVWTYKNTWYWASASGYVDGHSFGMNLGYGFGDTSRATENVLFYDGVAHKLEHVHFDIPKNQDGSDAFLAVPWRFTDNHGRLDLKFFPMIDRASCTDALVIKSDQHQVFGLFSGDVTLDDGTVLTLRHFTGFAEKVSNLW